MKAYVGGATATCSLNLDTRWEWSASRPDRFTPGRTAGTHRTEDWVGRRTGKEVMGRKKLKPGRKYKYPSVVQPRAWAIYLLHVTYLKSELVEVWSQRKRASTVATLPTLHEAHCRKSHSNGYGFVKRDLSPNRNGGTGWYCRLNEIHLVTVLLQHKSILPFYNRVAQHFQQTRSQGLQI
jgi:hypothetical protein